MFEFLKKAFKSFTEKISKPKEKTIEEKESKPKALVKLEEEEKKKSILHKLATAVTETKLTEEQFLNLFKILEIELIQNNVAFPIIQQIRTNLESVLVGKTLPRTELLEKLKQTLRETIQDILESPKPIDILQLANEKKAKGEPLVLLFVGTNGHGKTTTLAKLAYLFQQNNFRCVFAASDTFRAASIEQLEYHATKLGVRVIKHKYGADPAAVAFDAIKAKDKDIVLIDTAGRQTPNTNLMEEMTKIKKVAKPDLTIFVGEAIAGSDLIEQAKAFNEKIGVDAIILTKADVDDKGGAILSVVQTINKPILYLGVGQNYKDLEKFESEKFISRIL
jgi:fused signal recognition particle receptor